MNKDITYFFAMLRLIKIHQDFRKKQLRLWFSHRRRVLKIKLQRLCYLKSNELLMKWKQINNLQPLQLTMEGIRYRRIWQNERSFDFWNRIVNFHYTSKEWIESFRMSKDSFLELCDLLRGELEPKPQFLVSRSYISTKTNSCCFIQTSKYCRIQSCWKCNGHT